MPLAATPRMCRQATAWGEANHQFILADPRLGINIQWCGNGNGPGPIALDGSAVMRSSAKGARADSPRLAAWR